MAKLRGKIDILPGQGSIFEIIEKIERDKTASHGQAAFPGQMNLDAPIRELITEALKRTSLSRYEVAGQMSRLLGKEITKAQLDSWSAESKGNNRFPLAYTGAFVRVTGNKELLRLVCANAGGFYIENEDALRLELGRIYEEKKELEAKEGLIRNILQTMNGKQTNREGNS
jgi:hypothetical protein